MELAGRVTRRRKLSGELRRYRETAGLSVRHVASAVGLTPGTISKIENGQQAILPRNVLALLTACGAPEDEVARLVKLAEQAEREAWWEGYGDAVPSWFRDFVDLEGDARQISTYSAELVDGLLQTPEYADALVRIGEPHLTASQRRARIELREARQERLTSPDGPNLHVLLHERVFAGPHGIMSRQIGHLLRLGEQPNITIQVVPLSVGFHPAMKGSFTVFQFPATYADLDCVYVETETDGIWRDRPEDVSRYLDVFGRTAGIALTVRDSCDLMGNLAA